MGGFIPKNVHDQGVDPLKVIPAKYEDRYSDPLNLVIKPPVEGPAAPTPPAPPPAAPNVADAQARIRMQQQRQAGDEQKRKRGRRSTIVTGDEGVGDTPLGRKTLVGS